MSAVAIGPDRLALAARVLDDFCREEGVDDPHVRERLAAWLLSRMTSEPAYEDLMRALRDRPTDGR